MMPFQSTTHLSHTYSFTSCNRQGFTYLLRFAKAAWLQAKAKLLSVPELVLSSFSQLAPWLRQYLHSSMLSKTFPGLPATAGPLTCKVTDLTYC